jgi:HAMP domain-containing protein
MRSIRSKIIVIVGTSLLLGSVAIGYLFHRDCQERIQAIGEESVRASVEAFNNLRQDSIDMMAGTVQALLGNETLNSAFASRDRPALLAASQPLYKDFNRRYGITHWNYWESEPSGQTSVKGLTNFLRTATPDKYGEFLERVTLAQVVQTKDFVDGLDLGNTGFALRVIHPVREKGSLCGYFEIGKDIGNFLESMHRQTGNEYALALVKQRLDQAKWESSRASRNLPNNWNDMPDLVLAKNTTKDDGIFAYQGSFDSISDRGQSLGTVERNGVTYTRGAFPLLDASGKIVGGVFVLRDITETYQAARRSQTQATVAIVGLMLLVGFGMILVFDRLIVVRLERMTEVATRVVGGEFQTEIVPSADDEIGRFEGLFEQFRTIFVGLVSELEQRNSKAA